MDPSLTFGYVMVALVFLFVFALIALMAWEFRFYAYWVIGAICGFIAGYHIGEAIWPNPFVVAIFGIAGLSLVLSIQGWLLDNLPDAWTHWIYGDS
ncbi:MAG: hypothetical protein Q7T74_00555 [Candidatus Saccharibacteria bacterium]|nr:hypothetical protein [Candidatus Saccharibacteria bacterium]